MNNVFHTCILHGVFVSRDETMQTTHYFLVLRDETLVSRDETLASFRESGNLQLTSTVHINIIISMCCLLVILPSMQPYPLLVTLPPTHTHTHTYTHTLSLTHTHTHTHTQVHV